MGMIKFYCDQCQQKLGVPDEYVGKKVRCTGCGSPVYVPEPEMHEAQPLDDFTSDSV